MKRNPENNLVEATFGELKKLGYKQVAPEQDKKGNCLPPPVGSLLCLLESSKDLWAELSAADIKISKVTPDKFLILTK